MTQNNWLFVDLLQFCSVCFMKYENFQNILVTFALILFCSNAYKNFCCADLWYELAIQSEIISTSTSLNKPTKTSFSFHLQMKSIFVKEAIALDEIQQTVKLNSDLKLFSFVVMQMRGKCYSFTTICYFNEKTF